MKLPYPKTKTLEGIIDWAESLVQALSQGTSDAVPVGTVVAYVGLTPPPGWLHCGINQVITRAEYPGLWRLLGTQFNTGGEAPDEARLPNGNAEASNFLGIWIIKAG